jgi:hypothetical protein
MIERSAMRKAMNEEVAVIATHNFGFASSIVCAFQRISESFVDKPVWVRKHRGNRHNAQVIEIKV